MNKARVGSLILIAGLTGLYGCGEATMEEHISAARQFQKANNIDAAIIEYKNSVQIDPQASLPRFELGKLYLEKGNYAGAEKELNRALELGHPASEVLPHLSVAYQYTGAENALTQIDHTTQGLTAVEKVKVGFYKIEALLKLDKKDEAKKLIDELLILETASVYKGLLKSMERILEKDIEGALSNTLTLREQSPGNKDVLLQLARLHLANEQKSEAAEVYQTYVEKFPKDINTKFTLAALLIDLMLLEQAEPIVDELLKLSRDNGVLNQFKGIIEASKGDYELALTHLERAIQNGRNEPAVRLLAGHSAYRLDDFPATSRHLSMIASKLPDDHPGLRMLADSLLQQGLSGDATDVLNRLEGDMEADAVLFSKAGFELLREGNIEDARKMVEKSSELSTSAEDFTRVGLLQLSLKDVDGIVNLEAAVEKAPESDLTQNTLLAAYLSTNQLDKAKALATEWIEKDANTINPWLGLVDIAIRENKPDEAEQALQSAAKIAPDDVRINLSKARLHAQQQQFDLAKREIMAALEIEPNNTAALSFLFAVEKEQGSGEEVIKNVKSKLSDNKDNVQLRLLLARMQYSLDKIDDMLATLKPFEQDESESAPKSYWQLRGQALLKNNQVSQAQEHFERWHKESPSSKSAVLGLLLIYDAQSKYEDGIDVLASYLKARNDRQLLTIKAYFHAMVRQIEEAREILGQLPEDFKSVPFVRGIEARIALQEGKGESAVEDALAAYNALPNSKNLVLVLASYEASNRHSEGFALLKEHIEKNPQDVRANMLYAERLIGKDDDEAKKAYENILKVTPDNFVVLNNLAYLYLQDNKLDRAEQLSRKAVEQRPDNADSVDTLAQVLIKKQKPEEALALYDRVINEKTRNEEVYLNYVELLFQQGKTALAERKLTDRQYKRQSAKQREQALKEQYL
ncbi:XrtA/PEP-CTERM system TPR-repeat protein PrsT [Alteromonas sp. ASW11-130]|uniref:XrtA/PEP-CTERM system TPR-repeat protein PrsT n=1 Tax=Alteromonas sp. ASW11-130 TaxID=3015775 RepID=UPI002242068D|nr:XrtA/PEP-CTERM system TPR-repeat protein PrsT [Alteromonas sp. ASW11-130]MCW8090551.1 PEP-CTERM system TPR-repeat protein PrsT [Alteromonas sp. ASW11-130]